MADEAIHNHPNAKEQEVEAIQAREQRIERMEQTLEQRLKRRLDQRFEELRVMLGALGLRADQNVKDGRRAYRVVPREEPVVRHISTNRTLQLRSEGLRDEDRGHDDEAEAHELGSWIREKGADAQDLVGLHVPSGPITRAKARQIQQAVESSLAGFLGQEETKSIGSLKGLT
ncbi:hypothetical protein CRG98_004538 [Punica granatum]|uniref:Uncharacterized protein n=1 Tax=Punica granatum TaxID=22663 RepID=A0A2I0L304_PUNGR|nr:hypothetical protein CRG98_004538 [Punica granatum]